MQRKACAPCSRPAHLGGCLAPCRLPRRGMAAFASPDGSEPSTSSSSSGSSSSTKSSGPVDIKEIRLPKTGYLSLADPTQEVYSKSTEPFDPSKKGGRYKSEFIWNTNWQETMKRDEQLQRQRADYLEREKAGAAGTGSGAASGEGDATGVVSFGLVSDLNRMDVDLSAVLNRKKAPAPAAQGGSGATAGLGPGSAAAAGGGAAGRLTKMQQAQSQQAALSPLSRGNVMKLQRSGRMTKDSRPLASSRSEDEAEKARLVEEERRKYEALKLDFQVWTLALTALGVATTYSTYSSDVAASYFVGSLGGFMYLRLLSKSVDAVGAQGIESSVGGITSQPRLLIPIILALSYNRWNQLYADQVGVTLQLLPMMVGFFTYKVAVLAREARDLLDDWSPAKQQQLQQQQQEAAAGKANDSS